MGFFVSPVFLLREDVGHQRFYQCYFMIFVTVEVRHQMFFECYFTSLETVEVGLQMCFLYFISIAYVTGIALPPQVPHFYGKNDLRGH